ncbi:MAG: CAP domain-containing protein [Negativicutes bacterium]|nr:CAP domain-containing protein [Negativicutes bacterium]
MKRQVIVLMIGSIILLLTAAVSGVAIGAPAGSAAVSQEEQLAFELINADRAASGRAVLAWNPQLAELARDYCHDMVSRNFFSHDNPEGQSPFDRMKARGIKFRAAAENLAGDSSVEAAEKAFMDSPGHRANILDSDFDQVGIGVGRERDGLVVVVQEFIGN